MMSVRVATNRKNFDAWVAQHAGIFAFLETSEWCGAIQRMGRTAEYIEVFDEEKKVASAVLDFHTLPFGEQYAVSPKGPVIEKTEDAREQAQKTEQVFHALKAYLHSKKCVFLRVEPRASPLPTSVILVKDVNPAATLVLPLGRTAEEILANMHAKTRYNIRLAEKKGVVVEVKKSIEILWSLMEQTGARDGFRLHPKKSYQAVLDNPNVEQLIALVNGEPAATGVFIRAGGTYTYLYGASNHAYREYMAPLLVQWTAMLRAKTGGAKEYDFFGIAPSTPRPEHFPSRHSAGTHVYDSAHRYAGVTRFKLGFGGEVYEEPGTFDLPIMGLKYKVYQAIKKIRQIF